jgi:CheY-like chemotaxis protein
MAQNGKLISVLLVDDDEDYYYLAKEAFQEAGLTESFSWVKGGEELFQYLETKTPSIILLDLNMPRMDGFEVLKRMKQDPRFRRIPVVILTTSKADADAIRSYDLGAASFISKPIDFSRLVDLVQTFKKYWFQIAALPAV